VRSVIDPKFDFTTAAVKWLEWHRPHIKERTASDYEQYILALERFGLGPSPLTEIHPGHFEQYQVWRKRNPKKGAGNPRINQELNCLKQILEQSGLWEPIKPFYKQLPMPKWKPPRVMSPEKEDEILEIAASNKNWEVAHCCLVITDNAGLGPGELRAVQIEHLRLEQKKVFAAAGDLGDKNEFRIAPAALNEPALAAFEILYERYKEVCKRQGIREESKHYLIPKRLKKGTYDPRQQASPSFIRTALREIRNIAGMPRLRHYDFRHQCLTTLLEIPEISIETVQAVARHKIGDRTIEHYSAIRKRRNKQPSTC
jgi:integrase